MTGLVFPDAHRRPRRTRADVLHLDRHSRTVGRGYDRTRGVMKAPANVDWVEMTAAAMPDGGSLRRARTIAAWALLVGSVIGWPASMLTLAKDEPPFVLSLSWLAIVLESGSLLTSSQVHEQQKRDSDDG